MRPDLDGTAVQPGRGPQAERRELRRCLGARCMTRLHWPRLLYLDIGFAVEQGRALQGLDRVEPLRTDALIALFSGSFAAARGHLEEVSRLTNQPIGDTYLALAYYYTGSAERARSMLETLARSESASTATRAGAALASVLAALGEATAARSHLERVLARGYRDHHVAYSLGAAYGQLGEFDAATRWLRTAADTGFACPPFYERDPLLEPVRRRGDFGTARSLGCFGTAADVWIGP